MSSLQVHSERSFREQMAKKAHTGIAIVWPAHFPGSVDPELHATALFLGNTETANFTKEDVEDALKHYLWPGWVKVTGHKWFGHNNDVRVLALERNNLLTITRQDIKSRLEAKCIHANTEFAFNPHVTISKEVGIGSIYPFPLDINLESPVVWWGDSRPLHTNHTPQEVAA